MKVPLWHAKTLTSVCQFSMPLSIRFALHLRNTLTSPLLFAALAIPVLGAENSPTNSSKISYSRASRPIRQANCQGCHQPAKAKGGYVMTEFKRFLAGGDNEGAAVVPGHTDQSSILKMITPKDGEVRMPKGKTPLVDSEVALITTWIRQGGEDD